MDVTLFHEEQGTIQRRVKQFASRFVLAETQSSFHLPPSLPSLVSGGSTFETMFISSRLGSENFRCTGLLLLKHGKMQRSTRSSVQWTVQRKLQKADAAVSLNLWSSSLLKISWCCKAHLRLPKIFFVRQGFAHVACMNQNQTLQSQLLCFISPH